MRKGIVFFLGVVFFIILVFLLLGSIESKAEILLNSYQENPLIFSFISLAILASDVVLPIPSTIVMYLNGYVMGIAGGFLLSLISLMISSFIGYYIGKRFSKRDQSPSFTNFFLRYGFASIILTRGIPILAEAISIVGGYTQMSLKKFTLFHVVGYLPVCFIYAYLGKYAKEEDAFLTVLLVSIGITILFWLYGYVLNKRRIKEIASPHL